MRPGPTLGPAVPAVPGPSAGPSLRPGPTIRAMAQGPGPKLRPSPALPPPRPTLDPIQQLNNLIGPTPRPGPRPPALAEADTGDEEGDQYEDEELGDYENLIRQGTITEFLKL